MVMDWENLARLFIQVPLYLKKEGGFFPPLVGRHLSPEGLMACFRERQDFCPWFYDFPVYTISDFFSLKCSLC